MRKFIFIFVFLFADVHAADVSVWGSYDVIPQAQQAFQLGVSVEWEHLVFDFSHGRQSVHWRVEAEPEWQMDEWQSGSIFATRVYPFHYQTFRPLVIWMHQSDLLRGKPFNDENEPTSDFLGLGLTFNLDRVEVDLAYGLLGRECAVFDCAASSKTNNEVLIRFRFELWRK